MAIAASGAAKLRLDGILLVNGMSMDGARVIVVSADAEPKVITEALDRFTLDLDLQAEYLISFERPGCVSKELRFSTKVPEDRMGSGGFFFPFQVTLAAPGNGRHYEYAGPVGFIHYVKEINAFGYDTDYRVARNEALAERLELVRRTLELPAPGTAAPVPASTPAGNPVSARKDIQREANVGPGSFATVASTVSEVAPKVHVIKTIANDVSRVPGKDEALSTEGGMHSGKNMQVQEGHQPLALAYEPPTPVESGDFTRDLELGKLHTTSIIRVRRGTQENEYRRVVSYYGGVTYFCNGHPCSEATYNLGVSR